MVLRDARMGFLGSATFREPVEQATANRLDSWGDTADGALALVIVLDQFPLNMFRNQPASFATEAKAIAVSRRAIAAGFDKALPQKRVAFLYMADRRYLGPLPP